VNGGGKYRRRVIALPGRPEGQNFRLDDHRYAKFGRAEPEGRAEFRQELHRTVSLLRNTASLAVWVPFNEGWGQFDANELSKELRALDPSRTIDHASGWHDQGGGDLWSLHVYKRPFEVPPREVGEGRVLALTEYGGYDLAVPGHAIVTNQYGYRTFESASELLAAFSRLHRDELSPAVALGLSASVYTQLSDVEDEVNGILTYDREVIKLPASAVRDALAGVRLT